MGGSQIPGTSQTRTDVAQGQPNTQFSSVLTEARRNNNNRSESGSRDSSSSESGSETSDGKGSISSSGDVQVNACFMNDREEEGSGNNGSLMSELPAPEENMSRMPDRRSGTGTGTDGNPAEILVATGERIRNRLAANMSSDPGRSEAENRLAAEDPVSLAFLQELDADIDSNKPGQSEHEKALANKSPLTSGLLQYNGVRIQSGRAGIPSVTVKGAAVSLTPQQKELFRTGNIVAFANSVLTGTKPDERLQYLAAATASVRIDYTGEQVTSLVKNGQDLQALKVLHTNLNGAFSAVERSAIWQIAGADYFTQDYFSRKITENSKGFSADARMNSVGGYLQEVAAVAPPEAAGIALKAFTTSYSPDWIDGKSNAHGAVYGSSSGAALYRGISALSEQSPELAPGIASWLTAGNGGGNSLFARLERNDFEAVVAAAQGGHGVALAEAINKNLQQAAEANPVSRGFLWNSDSPEKSRFESFGEKLEEARVEAGKRYYADYVSEQFRIFNADPVSGTQPFFQSLNGDDRIGNTLRISNDTELRNLVGKSMGYIPDNENAALSGNYGQDWYSEGSEQRRNIDLITGWIKREGGQGLSVRSNPFIYASEKAGVSKGALFEVTGQNGNSVVIDGSIADDIIAQNGGKPVSPNDDTDIPWKYDSTEEFFDDNMLDPEGRVYMAKSGKLIDRNGDGRIDIVSRAAANVTLWEHASPWVDTAVGVVGVVGGVVLAIPSGGTSLGISAGAAGLMVGGSMAYGLVRSTQELAHMSGHGQDVWTLENQQARGAWLGIAGTVFAAGSIGAGIRAGTQIAQSSSMVASSSATLIRQGTVLANRAKLWSEISRTSGYAGATIGVEQMGEQGYSLSAHWAEMSAQDKGLAFLNLAMGVIDTGTGAWAHQQQKRVQTRKEALLAEANSRQQSGTQDQTGNPASGSSPSQARENIAGPEIDQNLPPETIAFASRVLPANIRVVLGDNVTATGSSQYSLPGFESAALRAVSDFQQQKAAPQQWKALLEKSPGIKKDELDWMGVIDWLDQQTGSVTKESLLSYMHAHRIRLDEKILGHNAEVAVNLKDVTASSTFTEAERAPYKSVHEYQIAHEALYRVLETKDGQFEIYHRTPDEGIDEDFDYPGALKAGTTGSLDAAKRFIEQHYISDHTAAKYPGFKVPGGSEYRELLIRVPSLEGVTSTANFSDHEIVHVRFDTRHVDGKKILFINEVQSDMHQAGRRYGYNRKSGPELEHFRKLNHDINELGIRKQELLTAATKAEDILIDDVIDALELTDLTPLTDTTIESAVSYVMNWEIGGMKKARKHLTDEQAAILDTKVRPSRNVELLRQLNDDSNRVGTAYRRKLRQREKLLAGWGDQQQPLDTPFKGSLWMELALKRMIKFANDNGYDGISWARSDQIAPMVETTPDKLTLLYDQQIGKFLSKYTKQWGGKIEHQQILGADDIEISLAKMRQAKEDIRASTDPKPGRYSLANLLAQAEEMVREGATVEEALAVLPAEALRFYNEAIVPDFGTNPVLMLTPEMKSITTQKLSIRDGIPQGRYDSVNRLLEVSRSALDPEGVIRHETIHALKDMQLFTDEEWKMLTDAARDGNWIEKHKIEERYREAYADRSDRSSLLLEESIADQFMLWRDGKVQVSSGVRAVFEKILKFLQQLGINLRREGISTYEDVFRRIKSGEVGSRGNSSDHNRVNIDPEISAESSDFTRRVLPSSVQLRLADNIPTDNTSLYALPGFESAAIAAVRDHRQSKATAQQWKALLEKTPGIKKDELQWMGVIEWLSKQKGAVSKEDLLDFMETYQIDIDEVFLEHAPAITPKIEDVTSRFGLSREDKNNEIMEVHYFNVEDLGAFRVELEEGKQQYDIYRIDDTLTDRVPAIARWHYFGEAASLAEAQHMITGHASEKLNEGNSTTRFSEHSIPGGTGYRELLIRLPALEPYYRSKHFENQELVHVRFDDRTISLDQGTGTRRVLFINEIQSDLHQKGRKSGYITQAQRNKARQIASASPETAEAYKEAVRYIEAENLRGLIESNIDKHIFGITGKAGTREQISLLTELLMNDNSKIGGLFESGLEDDVFDSVYQKLGPDTVTKIIEEASTSYWFQILHDGLSANIPRYNIPGVSWEKFGKLHAVYNREGIPDAPFKGDHWLELSLKRMIKYAADNGYDAIAWARSDQIAKAVAANPKTLRQHYDSKIGKFLDKYTKPYNGKVETATFVDSQPNQILMLTPELRNIGIQKLNVRDGRAEGAFDINQSLLTVSRSALDPASVVRHETIHALKDMGLFTEQEWNTLLTAARDENWADRFSIKDRYKDAYADHPDRNGILLEESIAEQFAHWREGKVQVSSGVRAVFEKILKFLQQLGINLKREGISTYEDVFRRIESGEVGSRTDRAASATGNIDPVLSADAMAFARKVLPPDIRIEVSDDIQPRRPLPGFEYAAIRAVEDFPQNRATPQQWKALLERAPGVKKDTLDWMGVTEWLDGQTGRVEKADLLAFMNEHQVILEERLVDGSVPPHQVRVTEEPVQFPLTKDEIERNITSIHQLRLDIEGIPFTDKMIEEFGGDATKPFRVLGRASGSFDVTDELGNIIYKNLPSLDEAKVRLNSHAEGFVFFFERPRFSELVVGNYRDDIGTNYAELLLRFPPLKGKVKSENFKDYEIAYVRFDERTAPAEDGGKPKRVLFINEIQSDIHENRMPGPVPAAPFRGDQWIELSLKRMIRYAVDNGFDAISWATAAQIGKAVGADPKDITHIYDRKIPRFMEKYVRQWDGNIDQATIVPSSGHTNQLIYITPEMRNLGVQKLSIGN